MSKRLLIPLIAVLIAFGVLQLKHKYLDYKPAAIIPPQQISLPDRVEQVSDSVVHIVNETQGWQGSGVAISPNIIMTARHVVEGGDDFIITLPDANEYKAIRAISSKKYDLGFIKLDEPVLKPARLGSIKNCRLGEQVYTVGSPFGKLNFNSVTLGIISGLNRDCDKWAVKYGYREYGWSVLLQTDAPAYPGNSGCPLFNMNGRAIAIVVGGFGDNLVYCIPIDLVIKDLPLIDALFVMNQYELEEANSYYNYEEKNEYY